MNLPDHTRTKRRLAFLFSIPLAFSLAFFLVYVASEHTDTQLLDIQSLSSAVNQLRSLATDAESGERGYLLMGEDRYLLPLQQATREFPIQVRSCLNLADQEPALRPQIERLASLVTQRFAQAEAALQLQRTSGLHAALESVRSGQSEATMDEIRKSVRQLLRDLDTQRDAYLANEHRLRNLTFGFFVTGFLITLLVTVWLYNALLAHLYARETTQIALQKLNAELEARIDERTRELQESNEELQQFAYVASHDLQEPLRTITSFSQLLEAKYRGRLDNDADEFIGYIVSSSRRMTDLINGLLALVRLRKTGQPVTAVSFEKLLEDAEVGLQAAIRESGARIERGALPDLVVDQVQFVQVFQNLISNAIKYKRDEPPVIRVEARRDSSNWIISVSDNGSGFKQEFAERIFGLFQRLHLRSVEGTGMGLAIVRKIVERHGGRIWAESKEGVGSTFFFSLPVSLESSRQQAATVNA
ncbi:MAG TPA: ATP-binding protein [Bryobacteraceae bacterium]|jgi:signal transduction histidine kinase